MRELVDSFRFDFLCFIHCDILSIILITLPLKIRFFVIGFYLSFLFRNLLFEFDNVLLEI